MEKVLPPLRPISCVMVISWDNHGSNWKQQAHSFQVVTASISDTSDGWHCQRHVTVVVTTVLLVLKPTCISLYALLVKIRACHVHSFFSVGVDFSFRELLMSAVCRLSCQHFAQQHFTTERTVLRFEINVVICALFIIIVFYLFV